MSDDMEKYADIGQSIGVAASHFIRIMQDIDDLKKRVAELELAQTRNGPAIQAAWNFVPIGYRHD